MYKTILCVSAAAIFASFGAYAEDSQKDSQDSKATEQTLAGCNCGDRDRDGKKKGKKDGDNRVAHCGTEAEHIEDEVQTPENTLACDKC